MAKPKPARQWDRASLDWYVEPERATDALLSAERFSGPVFDPACGQGNIVRALHRHGYYAVGADLVNRLEKQEIWFLGESDFMGDPLIPNIENIVTNPPYFRAKGTQDFIEQALSIARHKVAVFSGIGFLAGETRAKTIFRDNPPHRAWVITPRPSCPPGDYLREGNKAGNGSGDYVWMVWDVTAPPARRPALGWLTQ